MDEKALHIRVAELEDLVAYLKSELGLSVRATQIGALTQTGMGTHHAKALLALRAANGRTLSVFQIADAAGFTPQTAKIVTCQARKWAPGIENLRGSGYSLNAEGRVFVDELLKQRATASGGGLATASND